MSLSNAGLIREQTEPVIVRCFDEDSAYKNYAALCRIIPKTHGNNPATVVVGNFHNSVCSYAIRRDVMMIIDVFLHLDD